MTGKLKTLFTIFSSFFGVIGLVLVILVITLGINIIPDGFVGVKQTLGNYNDEELGTGVHLIIPFISSIQKVDTRRHITREQ